MIGLGDLAAGLPLIVGANEWCFQPRKDIGEAQKTAIKSGPSEC
jgi:hypothetical protein